ncbi:MAG TPA: hypothetical protein VI816_03820 [Candidatus Bathyarchaeia archaeon]|nr:hypothetical protein [Candidatus Bathyarchaeia archaeon]
MQFRIVLLGVALLVVGLVSYSSIPNIHRTPVLTTQSIMGENLSIIAGSSVTVPRNITISQGKQNDLRINITVTAQSGELATLRFQVFPRNNSMSCSTTQPTSFLVSQKVSNETLLVPMNSTGTYCFIFDNEDYPTSKTASVSAFLDTRSEQVRVAKDGGANTAGLGLGAFGFLVLLYGVTRKTVIPWE